MPIKVVAWFTSCTLSYCRSSVSRACDHTHSRHGRTRSVGVILYMHSPCDMSIHRPKSPATCLQKRLKSMGNGRPHAVDIIQFYRILTTDVTLVITGSLEFVHHLGMPKTLNTRRANRQNLTSTQDVSVHVQTWKSCVLFMVKL
jgi:hypothetical protein